MNRSLIVSTIAIAISCFTLGLATVPQESAQTFGGTASNPGVSAIFETSLAAPIGTTDTTMTLASNSIIGSITLPNGYTCFTLDSGTNVTEYVCGTVAGTAVSGMLRGVSPTTGTTTSPTLAFTHRRGADVKITDWPALGILNNQLNGIESIPNRIYYQSNFTPSFWSSAASNTIATLGIVNDTAAAGCGNANTTANGCVQLATALQAASSTVTGSTGANLALWSSYATDTPTQSTASGSKIVMSLIGGYISQAWINLTQPFTWAAQHTFQAGLLSTASTTIAATTTISASSVTNNALVLDGIAYKFPSVQGASSSRLTTNGAGSLSWQTPVYSVISDSNASFAGATTTVTIPANTFGAKAQVRVRFNCNPAGASAWCGVVLGNGSATSSVTFANNAGTVMTGDITIALTGSNTEAWGGLAVNGAGTVVGVGNTLAWTTTSPSFVQFGAIGSGAVFNSYSVDVVNQ